MSELLEYLDRERLKISFTTLILRVSSINKYYGQLSKFVKEADLYGVTNGKIHLMAEMMEPPYGLYNIIDKHLIPLGLEEGRDYIFVTEKLVVGLNGKKNILLNKPLPELEKISWLDSLITSSGNYVWFKYNSEASQKQKKRAIQKRLF